MKWTKYFSRWTSLTSHFSKTNQKGKKTLKKIKSVLENLKNVWIKWNLWWRFFITMTLTLQNAANYTKIISCSCSRSIRLNLFLLNFQFPSTETLILSLTRNHSTIFSTTFKESFCHGSVSYLNIPIFPKPNKSEMDSEGVWRMSSCFLGVFLMSQFFFCVGNFVCWDNKLDFPFFSQVRTIGDGNMLIAIEFERVWG